EAVEAGVRGAARRIVRADGEAGDVAIREVGRQRELLPRAVGIRGDAAREALVVAGAAPRRPDYVVAAGDRRRRVTGALIEHIAPVAAALDGEAAIERPDVLAAGHPVILVHAI